jgi:hypothetical protein
VVEGLNKLKKKIHLIGTRTRDRPACSIVPEPTTLRHTPFHTLTYYKSVQVATELNNRSITYVSTHLEGKNIKVDKACFLCTVNEGYREDYAKSFVNMKPQLLL